MYKFQGVHTALVTPFDSDGNLNEEVLRQNIRFQLKNHVDGLVILGTTAEAPTLTTSEKQRITEISFEENKKASVLTIGTGCYSTAKTIENTKLAEDNGADAALIVTPYYNKPTQEGLFLHFKAVAEAVNIPIIVYNIAGRTGQNMMTDTLQRLSDIPNIVGVKEASGNIMQMMDVYDRIAINRPDFSLLSGDDALTLPAMAIGAHGVISVVSNLVPDLIKCLTNYLSEGDFESARELHYRLQPLLKGAFIETNPIPIKALMNLFGMDVGLCRLPLCNLTEENNLALKNILNKYQTKINSYA